MRKASLFRLLLLMAASVAVTFWYCLRGIWVGTLYRNPRPAMDRVCRRWSQWLVRLIDLRWQVRGQMPVLESNRRYIIMCSHASHYDIPLSFVALPGSLRMLAKKELSRIPVFGLAMRAAEFIFIDRHNREQALKDLAAARAKMESGIVLWVSPEGTRSVDGKLLPFKKGCFHLAIDTQAIIIPVAIRNISTVLPKGTFNLNLGVETEVHIGAPIDASNYSIETRQALSDSVATAMQALLGQPDPIAAEASTSTLQGEHA
ncbi:1-acyl-sn-glycerol-3-phosphate acyltransferase [Permianibacter sp. IMCC34836]|uniref:lysophospholipid acyltransferase family protein n=1 Tax=Permianibacter fluminis TaxID=2738515 RepID=UPI0015516E72|nr:lysophospholipid acyltransferase family protein [Permianibacter fluminis]NQD38158.1 1-acyl-sn-glycerol-3-phosphate acyltransferase [Permianibacter fluminis]